MQFVILFYHWMYPNSDLLMTRLLFLQFSGFISKSVPPKGLFVKVEVQNGRSLNNVLCNLMGKEDLYFS